MQTWLVSHLCHIACADCGADESTIDALVMSSSEVISCLVYSSYYQVVRALPVADNLEDQRIYSAKWKVKCGRTRRLIMGNLAMTKPRIWLNGLTT